MTVPEQPGALVASLPPDLPSCSESDRERLQFLYEEWAHPYFVSKEEYGRIMEVRQPRCAFVQAGCGTLGLLLLLLLLLLACPGFRPLV